MMGAEMRRMIVMAALAACGEKSASPPTPGSASGSGAAEPVLVTQGELAAWRSEVKARVDSNAARACMRPVVRPPAIAGPAKSDQLALVDPAGPCLAPDMTMPACLAALHQAVSHSDSCSPYQVGTGGVSSDLTEYTRLARVIPRSDPWALVELAAHLQDVARGSVQTVIQAEMDLLLATVLDALVDLAQHTKLPPELGPALATLQEAMPGVADSFAAQHDHELLQAAALPFADESGAIMLALRHRAALVGKACPATTTLAACHASLLALAPSAQPPELTVAAAIEAVRADPARREEMRDRLVAWIGVAAGQVQASFVSARARTVAQLASLQVLVAAQRMPTCPEPPQLVSAPLYKTLLAPPLLGASLRVADRPTRLAPPAFVTPRVEWNIVCP